ncbi:MAG: hypothetical protein C5B49_15090 [Bdellovibrio sp.]|nr:MAG: hypothetical protein C5B49_15090 [Bdellovibrio sp.]
MPPNTRGGFAGHAPVQELMMSLFGDFTNEIQDLVKFRWVSISLVSSTLRTRYKRSILGFFWSLLGPILSYTVMGYVFSFLMKGMVPDFFVYMFSATLIYNLLSVTILSSPAIMIANEGFIKKIYLPKSLFVVNTVALEFINFLFGMVALLFLGLVFRKLTFSWAYMYLPVPMVFALLFNFGIASMISVASVFFRDLTHILPVLMQALFFATPIMYTMDILPPEIQPYTVFNPLLYFVESFRYPIYRGTLPPAEIQVPLMLISLFIFVAGYWILKKFENKIVFRL